MGVETHPLAVQVTSGDVREIDTGLAHIAIHGARLLPGILALSGVEAPEKLHAGQ